MSALRSKQNPMDHIASLSLREGRQRLLASGIAVLGVALVIAIRYTSVHFWGYRYPFSMFFGVIVIASWIGGRRAGFLAMILGWVSVVWVMPRLGIFPKHVVDGLGNFLYLSQATLVVLAFASMRNRIETIMEKRRAEAELAESRQQHALSLAEAELHLRRLKMIEGAVNAGTWEFDVNSGVSTWPAGISSLWGLPAEEHHIPFDEFISRMHPDDRERVGKMVQSAVAKGDSYEVEFRVIWPDRSIHWLSARGAVLRDEHDQPRKVIGIALEVTQRRQTEKALRESEKLAATGRMAATIAHEINNPLEAVVNLVYLAKSDPNISPSTREYLASADTELARVSHMVRQTLGFYREDSSPSWIDVAEMVEQVTDLYHNKLIRKNVKVDIHTQAAEVFGVEGELRQVVSNLVSNAIDAVEMNGRISIRVRQFLRNAGSVVRIVVADNGHGIAPENRHKLFQPFFTTKANVGTGLGLWVSSGIIEKHNGRISLRTSTRAGRNGTVFCVELPVGQDAAFVQRATVAV
jgi:signal transduction histidine kinase